MAQRQIGSICSRGVRRTATADVVEIESLAERLNVEAEAKKTTAFLPRWVCAWARVS